MAEECREGMAGESNKSRRRDHKTGVRKAPHWGYLLGLHAEDRRCFLAMTHPILGDGEAGSAAISKHGQDPTNAQG
jgi:hypothetical protein